MNIELSELAKMNFFKDVTIPLSAIKSKRSNDTLSIDEIHIDDINGTKNQFSTLPDKILIEFVN